MTPGLSIAPRVTGVVGGLASGLLGIGGGLLIVPLLTLWARVPLKVAVGTSMLAMVVTSAVGIATESLAHPDNVRWLPAALLASGAVIGAQAGARLIQRTSPRALARLLAVLLLVGALKMSGALGLVAGAAGLGATSSAGVVAPEAAFALHAATGLGAGVISSLFGIGGGILAIPVLATLHPDWGFHACRATSLAMVIPGALVGAWLHRRLGHVDAALARAMVPGCVAGSVAGVLLANVLPAYPLQLLFAAVLLWSAYRLATQPGAAA